VVTSESGTFQTWSIWPMMSAPGGKADLAVTSDNRGNSFF
jgi:hypothetical protein